LFEGAADMIVQEVEAKDQSEAQALSANAMSDNTTQPIFSDEIDLTQLDEKSLKTLVLLLLLSVTGSLSMETIFKDAIYT
jgi:hypothetical protein